MSESWDELKARRMAEPGALGAYGFRARIHLATEALCKLLRELDWDTEGQVWEQLGIAIEDAVTPILIQYGRELAAKDIARQWAGCEDRLDWSTAIDHFVKIARGVFDG